MTELKVKQIWLPVTDSDRTKSVKQMLGWHDPGLVANTEHTPWRSWCTASISCFKSNLYLYCSLQDYWWPDLRPPTLPLAELHVLILMSFIKLMKLLQNLLKLFKAYQIINWFQVSYYMIIQQKRYWNLNIYLKTFDWPVYPLISSTKSGISARVRPPTWLTRSLFNFAAVANSCCKHEN